MEQFSRTKQIYSEIPEPFRSYQQPKRGTGPQNEAQMSDMLFIMTALSIVLEDEKSTTKGNLGNSNNSVL